MMDNTANLLRRAADILGEKGWCQGSLTNPDGNVCAMGAFHQAAYEIYPEAQEFYSPADFSVMYDRMQVQSDAASAMAHVLDLPEPRYFSELGLTKNPIPAWNDAPERSAEDVILAMKNAAQHVEESSAQSDPC